VIKWYSPQAVDQLAGALETEPAAAVLVLSHSQMAPYRHLFGGPVMVDMHNVESQLIASYRKSAGPLFRLVLGWDSLALARVERKIARWADALVVVSDHDAQVVTGWGSREPLVAPNGVSQEAFRTVRADRDPAHPVIAFVGHLGWRPNVDACVWLVEEVFPHVLKECPGAIIRLVGRTPSERVTSLRSENVEIHGDVDSVLPLVASADVATAPLLAAGGTRLKIIEALATGTPVVATGLGALGLEHLSSSGALAMEDRPAPFAEALIRLIREPPDPDSTRRLVSSYEWGAVMRPAIEKIKELAG
jgi:glycosyltransferase involved in cell wall biosynthesis